MSKRGRGRGIFGTVSRRIVAIVGAVSVAFLVGAGWFYMSESNAAKELKTRITQERGGLIDRIAEAEKLRLESIVAEFSQRPNSVSLVQGGAKVRAALAVPQFLKASEFSALHAFRPDGQLVSDYAITQSVKKSTKKLSLNEGSFASNGSSSMIWHEIVDGQIVECVASPVMAQRQNASTREPIGTVVCSRIWGDKEFQNLKERTGSAPYLHGGDGVLSLANRQKVSPPLIHDISNFWTLKNRDGSVVAQLEFRAASPAIAAVNRNASQAIATIVIFVLSFILLLSISLQFWVAKPMGIIVRGLGNTEPESLAQLENDPTEFGSIAELILAFNDQKREIEATNGELQESLAELASMNEKLDIRVQERTRELYEAYEATIEGWSRAMEVRDQETQGHCYRVTQMSLLLARVMGLSPLETLRLKRGALLHDIGKMGIPDGVLLKPGRLTPEERKVMEQHPIIAYEMLKPISFLGDCLDVPLYHHEKWDGTGYPYGLTGEVIPLNARIFAVADVWDAMRSDRPYREAWDEARTRAYIEELSGTHFDPQVVQAYLSISDHELTFLRGASLGNNADQTASKAA